MFSSLLSIDQGQERTLELHEDQSLGSYCNLGILRQERGEKGWEFDQTQLKITNVSILRIMFCINVLLLNNNNNDNFNKTQRSLQ